MRSDPILHDLLCAVRFFNGRLLTGDALTREQRAIAERHRLLASALGTGVVTGLEVEPHAASSPAAPKVQVRAGAAIGASGALVVLAEDTTLELASLVATTRGAFYPSRARTDARVDGLILVAIAPCRVARGRTLNAAANGESLAPDRDAEGVTLVALPMDALEEQLAIELVDALGATESDDAPTGLRNAMAARCLASRDGPVESLLACDPELASDAVPLAVLLCRPLDGVSWVDVWAARRPLDALDPSRGASLDPQAPDPGLACARARQLEAQLAPGDTAAAYRWLPPAADLTAGCRSWTEVKALLGQLCPIAPVPIDPALVPALLATSAAGGLIDRFADPRPALDVFAAQLPDGTNRWIYVRSVAARLEIRLSLSEGEAALSADEWAEIECVASSGGQSWSLTADASSGLLCSGPLPPGEYAVSLSSDALLAVRTLRAVVARGGQVRRLSLNATRSVGGLSEPDRRHYL